MSRSAVQRREGLTYRSVFDYHELSKHFIETGLLTKAQVEKLLKGAALCTQPPQEIVPWKSIAPELPHAAYKQLDKLNFKRYTSTIVDHLTSERKDTCKLLIRLQDGHEVETCIMRFGLENDETERLVFSSQSRATVCVSSQVGCKMGCTFCATGTMGLLANLTSGEILEQIMMANIIEREFRTNEMVEKVIVAAKDGRYIRNVVFMGMGEPLDNYIEVIRSIRCLTNAKIFALAPSRITLSTVGYSVPRIRNLIDDIPRCSLALSLHAPTQRLRDEIVPTSKGVDLHNLLAACFAFVANQKQLSKTNAKRQCLLVEYCIIANKNDTEECAKELGLLFKDRVDDVMVNIIPYNSTDVKANFETPSDERIDAFVTRVRSYGVRVFVRQEHGRDISGACGQLAVSKKVGDGPLEDVQVEDPSELSEDDELETPKSSERIASHFTSLAEDDAEERREYPAKKETETQARPDNAPDAMQATEGPSTISKDMLPLTSPKAPLQVTTQPATQSDVCAPLMGATEETSLTEGDATCSQTPLTRLWRFLTGPQDPENANEIECKTAARERASRRILIGGGLLLAGTLLVRHLLVSFDPPKSSSRRRPR